VQFWRSACAAFHARCRRGTPAAPDLVLLDIELPQMDGYAVARVLRGIPALDAVPIVAVTSYALNGDRAKARAAGCDGHIEKSIDPDRFAGQVEAMSSHRPYRPGPGIDKALAEIERGRGCAYDPAVADACLKLFRENGFALPG
jgi:CheY-like chemotaxis protein